MDSVDNSIKNTSISCCAINCVRVSSPYVSGHKLITRWNCEDDSFSKSYCIAQLAKNMTYFASLEASGPDQVS